MSIIGWIVFGVLALATAGLTVFWLGLIVYDAITSGTKMVKGTYWIDPPATPTMPYPPPQPPAGSVLRPHPQRTARSANPSAG